MNDILNLRIYAKEIMSFTTNEYYVNEYCMLEQTAIPVGINHITLNMPVIAVNIVILAWIGTREEGRNGVKDE